MNSTKAILDAKMAGNNPFVAEFRSDVVWISDKEGTFEFEMLIPGESDWERIEFTHEDTQYEGDINVYIQDNGAPRIGVYAVNGARTLGDEFITIDGVII